MSMALYVDCAFLNDIMQVVETVPLAGVTTNPSILLAARTGGQKLSPPEVLGELLRVVDGDIFMQPGATEEEEMYRQAKSYIEAAPLRVIPKIPMTQAGMRAARRLKREQHRIAFTAVTSLAQAYSAAMARADYIIPYFGRLERAGIDAGQRIAEMADVLHNAGGSTRILTASIKSIDDAGCALLSGSDDLTVTPQVLMDMLTDPLTGEAVERFTHDWQLMNNM
ncbi:MAG: fructose-6-phosphate aldolase [Ktedonobacteraceae bacterium]